MTRMDPYHRIAQVYDRLFESMNKGLRLAGIRMFRPASGMDILDVGCGTGSHLDLYRRYKCNLYGLDASPSMLAVAERRLGDAAKLDLGTASDMPYEDDSFDLVITMLCLHEMAPATRAASVQEIRRVLRDDGRALLIDYNPGRIRSREAWKPKVIILLSEVAAGWEHFRNYRHYMATGGLPTLAAQHGLNMEKQKTLAGATFAIYLANQANGKHKDVGPHNGQRAQGYPAPVVPESRYDKPGAAI